MSCVLPLLFAALCAAFIVTSRLLTNRVCDARAEDIIAAGTTSGFIPVWLSAFYMSGFIGFVVALIWSFIATAWWAPAIVVLLYLVSGFVKSPLPAINMLIQFDRARKA